MTPACMTPDELRLWRQADARYRHAPPVAMPCLDCPLAFALEMRAEGCCNGTPGRAVRETGVSRPHPEGGYVTSAERAAARRRTYRESKARRRAA